MKAELVIRERIVFGDGAILEIKVWRVPVQVPASRHFLKYSLVYRMPGQRLVGYDNEGGNGDHRHYGARQVSDVFTSIDQLLADFRSDVESVRGERI